MIINDIAIVGPFRVLDLTTGNYIFSWLETSAPGDIPPDIAVLPIHGLRKVDDVLYIDTFA